MEEKTLNQIKSDALKIIETKIEGIKMAKSIQDLIDNSLCDVMCCPGCYGFKEIDCDHGSCKSCWQSALTSE